MTILYSEAIMITPGWYIMLMFILFLVGLLILFALPILEKYSAQIAIFSLICIISALIMGFYNYQIDSGKKQYNVIFNEKQDLMEFNSKYRVIDQKGDMFIIEDR